MKRLLIARATVSRAFACLLLVLIFTTTYTPAALAQRALNEDVNDLHRALAAATSGENQETPDEIESCSGCCSSHGGITSSCAGNGHVICRDGSVSPSCLCSSCGTSPPPPPTCSGGSYWNGFACVCPAGETFVNGVCSVPVQTCSGGMVWTGTMCACPRGEEFIYGQCQPVSVPFTIGGGISGSWYDPAQSGHGFLIEVIKGTDQAQAIWFAFDNNGHQTWIVAEGAISGNQVTMPALLVEGGRFPPHFDAALIERNAWGTLTFTFADCDHGTVQWTTRNPAFTGSGTMNLVRLTSIEGTTCP
jgi:hypothetical protein